MTYIVTDNCIKCKYMDCVEVCPVDCFYEGENMLVIHPDECIDCGVCEPECPAEAIKPDTEPGLDKWLEVNTKYASAWPNITEKSEPPADAKEWDGARASSKSTSPRPRRGRLRAAHLSAGTVPTQYACRVPAVNPIDSAILILPKKCARVLKSMQPQPVPQGTLFLTGS